MKKYFSISALFVCFLLITMPASAEFTKSKIAILDFQVQGKQYENTDMGAIVAEWLITALVKEGRFDVVERRLLKKILSEHQLAMAGVVDDRSITELGSLLGVKIIISGAVLHFQNLIEVNARIIDVTSASIIAAESVKSTTAVGLEELVVQMAEKIIKDFPLEGYIVRRKGDNVAIDLGRRAGVKPGMRFIVFKEGDVIKHPKTGEVLDVEIIETGKLKVTKVTKKIAHAEIIEEADILSIEYGQRVKSVSGSSGSIGKYTTTETPLAVAPATTYLAELAALDPSIEEVRRLKETNDPLLKPRYKELFYKLKPIYVKNPTSPEVFFYYAKACEAGGALRKANKYIAKAVYYNPKYIEAYEFQGDMNYNFGKNLPISGKTFKLAQIAQRAYDSAASLHPESEYKAMMYYKIGRTYSELSTDTAMVDQYMQKAISIAPDSEAAQLAAGN